MMKKPQLFLLHFAGGSIYSFQFLRPALPGFDFIPVELPGRGRRVREKLLNSIDLAAEDMHRQIRAQLHEGPFLLYGHSMGTMLALRVAGLLENIGRQPAAIIVSGNAGPGTRDNKKRYLMEKEAFKEELKNIGGMPDELLQNEELLDYFIPLLKADFEIAEQDFATTLHPVAAPIYAIMGAEEEQQHLIGHWRKYTTSIFEHEVWPGNHFFIYDHADRIAGVINYCYHRAAALNKLSNQTT